MNRISFQYADVPLVLPHKLRLRRWIQEVIRLENCELISLTFIFCSDSYLLGINQEYLHHDYFTDVITFPYSVDKNFIEGDIFISHERVLDNSTQLAINFFDELCRVMIHGVLHLIGYTDSTVEQSLAMRQKEDYYLNLFITHTVPRGTK